MFSKILRGASLLLAAALFVAPVAVGGDIYLPAEYFFGRWAPGHEIRYEYYDYADTDECNGTSHYRYTASSFQLGLNYIQNRIFLELTDSTTSTSSAVCQIRPQKNWQFGLDWLYYFEKKYHSEPTNNLPRETTNVGRHLRGKMSSRWQNRDTVRIPQDVASYAYLVDRFIGKGGLQLDSYLWIEVDRNTAEVYDLDYSRIERELQPIWTLKNDLHYGVTDYLNLGLVFGLKYRLRSDDSRLIWMTTDENRDSNDDERWFQPYYRLGFVYKLPVPLCISGSLEQWFERYEEEVSRTIVDIDGRVSVREWELEKKLQEVTKRVRLGAHFITSGEFNPAILLDDYNNYYRQILFHRQVRISLDYWYREGGRPGTIPVRYADLSGVISVGLYNKLELSVSSIYRYIDSSRGCYRGRSYNENLSYSIGVRYRTYKYDQNSGPGWGRDSKYDVAFDPVLLPRHAYAELTVTPENLSRLTCEERGILSLSRLAGNDSVSVALSTSIGVGYGAELSFSGELVYWDSENVSRSVSLAGRQRLSEKWDGFVRIGELWTESADEERTFYLTVRCLL